MKKKLVSGNIEIQTWCWSQYAGATSGERPPKATYRGVRGDAPRGFFLEKASGAY